MSRWGKRHAETQKEVKRQEAIRKNNESKGKPADRRNLEDRGEAITRLADIKEARKSDPERKGKR